MMIETIADYLETMGIGDVGTTIFIGDMALNKPSVITLILAPSPAPNKSIPYYTQTIDVWTRYADAQQGLTKLKEIQKLLHRMDSYDIDDYHFYLSYSLGMIEDMDRDSENRKLYKLSLSFIYTVSLDNELS